MKIEVISAAFFLVLAGHMTHNGDLILALVYGVSGLLLLLLGRILSESTEDGKSNREINTEGGTN